MQWKLRQGTTAGLLTDTQYKRWKINDSFTSIFLNRFRYTESLCGDMQAKQQSVKYKCEEVLHLLTITSTYTDIYKTTISSKTIPSIKDEIQRNLLEYERRLLHHSKPQTLNLLDNSMDVHCITLLKLLLDTYTCNSWSTNISY